MFLLKNYTGIFSTVVFDAFEEYDDRENPPFLYSANYRIEPNTPMVSFKHDTTLPGPYIECAEKQSSWGDSVETDDWGCDIYSCPKTEYVSTETSCCGSCPGDGDNRYCREVTGKSNAWCSSGGQGGAVANKCSYPIQTMNGRCGGRVIAEDIYECEDNSCDGEEQGEDEYGCMTYERTWTTNPYICSIIGTPHYVYGAWNCPDGYEHGSSYRECCRRETRYHSESCGGATTSTCQGDDCYLKAYEEDYDDPCKPTPEKQSLTQWKQENPEQHSLINLGCGRPCMTKLMHYEDEYWIYEGDSGRGDNGDDSCATGTNHVPELNDGVLTIRTSSAKYSSVSHNFCNNVHASAKLTTSKNMRDTEGYINDLSILAECSGGYSHQCTSSGAPTYTKPSCNLKIGTFSYTIPEEETLFELITSTLNPDLAEVWINGRWEADVDFNGLENVNVSFSIGGGSPQLDIKEFVFLIPFSCQQSETELLGMQSFSSNQTGEKRLLSITDLPFRPTKFCSEHPTIQISSISGGSTTSNEIYNRLRKGEVLEIPNGHIWTLFWIFENDGTLPVTCGEDAYDFDTGKCRATGLASFCQGVIDPATGICVTTTEPACGPYGYYDVAQAECVYNIPIYGVCEIGNYMMPTGFCEYDSSGECVSGYTYNPERGACQGYPKAIIACEMGWSYDPQISWCKKDLGETECKDAGGLFVDNECLKSATSNVEQICPEGTTLQLRSGIFSCVYKPEDPFCIQGYLYDTETEECIADYEPDLDYLCEHGELNQTEDGFVCVITEEKIDWRLTLGGYDINIWMVIGALIVITFIILAIKGDKK